MPPWRSICAMRDSICRSRALLLAQRLLELRPLHGQHGAQLRRRDARSSGAGRSAPATGPVPSARGCSSAAAIAGCCNSGSRSADRYAPAAADRADRRTGAAGPRPARSGRIRRYETSALRLRLACRSALWPFDATSKSSGIFRPKAAAGDRAAPGPWGRRPQQPTASPDARRPSDRSPAGRVPSRRPRARSPPSRAPSSRGRRWSRAPVRTARVRRRAPRRGN